MPQPVRIIGFAALTLGAVASLASCAADSASSSTLTPMVVSTTAFATMPPVTMPPTTLPGETTTIPPGAPIDYVIKFGDYLYGIAKAHGVSADDIVTLNGWSSVNHELVPGETIKVPAPAAGSTGTTVATAPPSVTTPTVTTPTGAETSAPPASGGGAETTAPGGSTSTPPAGGEEYTVKNNDTVYGIANKFGITPGELVALNGWSDVTHPLHPGDTILVPAAG